MKKLLIFALVATATLAQAQLMIVDSGQDRVVLLDQNNGSIINGSFITDAASATTYDFNLPVMALRVNNEIWVNDRNADAIFRFDTNGSYLSKITDLDDPRSMALINGEVWVANNNTGNGATAGTIRRYSTAGMFVGDFSGATNTFGIVEFNNRLLVGNWDTEDIDQFDLSGNATGQFHSSDGVTGIDNPHQLFAEGNSVWAAGFGIPTGLYQFDANGNQTNRFDTSGSLGLRGVSRLGNGNMIVSGGTRIVSINTVLNSNSDLVNQAGTSWQHITSFEAVPEPTTMTLLGLAAFVALRKKRK
ncbi:hypothetical protein C0431_13360 [bacterium]|nr:hypothetical protein [bacterium]